MKEFHRVAGLIIQTPSENELFRLPVLDSGQAGVGIYLILLRQLPGLSNHIKMLVVEICLWSRKLTT